MVKFTASKSTQDKTTIPPIRHDGGMNGGLADKVLIIIADKPDITQNELAEKLSVPLRTLQRTIKEMRSKGLIFLVGGNRFGHWEVHR